MAFFDTIEDLEVGWIEFIHGSDTAEHGMANAGGAMNGEAERYEPIDNPLNLGFFRPFLHNDEHGFSETPTITPELFAARFMQRESYDHWVRDEQEWSSLYRKQPVKAGLASRPEDYRWSSAHQLHGKRVAGLGVATRRDTIPPS